MIKLILLFILLGVGLFAGTEYSGQQGYVLISIAGKTLEMSVTTMVVFVAIFFAAFFIIEIIIKKLLRISSDTWNWFGSRKLKRSRRFTNEGIIKLVEGDWKLAEKKVTRWANHHDMPLLCYLVAAEAAEEMGDREKRNYYLELAAKEDNSLLAVELTKAKQSVHDGEYQRAVDGLNKLAEAYPNNPRLLQLLKKSYLALENWQQLIELLPRLKRAKLLTLSEYEQLMLTAQLGFIDQAGQTHTREVIVDRWSQLPKHTRSNPQLIECYLNALIGANASDEAFSFIKEQMKKNPVPALFSLITELKLSDVKPAITLLENALHRDNGNAEAHSALARFYLQSDQLPEAQKHFEAALALRSNVGDYGHLVEVLERQNMASAANDLSRKALALMAPNHA